MRSPLSLTLLVASLHNNSESNRTCANLFADRSLSDPAVHPK